MLFLYIILKVPQVYQLLYYIYMNIFLYSDMI